MNEPVKTLPNVTTVDGFTCTGGPSRSEYWTAPDWKVEVELAFDVL